MKTVREVTTALRTACACAGGVSVWCGLKGFAAQRGNIDNMAKGKVKVATRVAQSLGLRKVILEVYLENGETIPPDFEPFVVTHKPIPGRPKK